ncbi:MAG TPA: META domain-containing protein [Vicinamibacterales bacterium]|jgi:heat shock protein HslJ
MPPAIIDTRNVALAVLLTLVGSIAMAQSGAGPPLEGTYWKAVELAGAPTPVQDPTREAHLEFHADGRVSGSDGCNRLAGTFQRNGDRLTFGQMIGTQMACIDPSGNEAPFREALRVAGRLRLAGDRLELMDANGTRVAGFIATRQPPTAALAGTSWQLIKFEGGDGATLRPDNSAKYTIQLLAGGSLTTRIDCNRGRGTWESSGPNQIAFGPLALTRAKCPPGSLYDQMVKQWGNMRSFVVKDGHLFLSLKADGGTYEFEPVKKNNP